jgi:hypothetical protein
MNKYGKSVTVTIRCHGMDELDARKQWEAISMLWHACTTMPENCSMHIYTCKSINLIMVYKYFNRNKSLRRCFSCKLKINKEIVNLSACAQRVIVARGRLLSTKEA